VISVSRLEWIEDGMGTKPFRFENAWTRHDRYTQTVEGEWQTEGNNLQEVYESLVGVRNKLKRWSIAEFGYVKK
jgi:hypothetical protein